MYSLQESSTRHYYNRSYITVNTTPFDNLVSTKSYTSVPRYTSSYAVDEFQQRSKTKTTTNASYSPTKSDEGYASSRATSPLARDDSTSAIRKNSLLRDASATGLNILPKKNEDTQPSSTSSRSRRGSSVDAKQRWKVQASPVKLKPDAEWIREKSDSGYNHASVVPRPRTRSEESRLVKSSVEKFNQQDIVERERAYAARMPEIFHKACKPLPEEKIRLSDGIVRLQAGTNKYDSQKGMTGFGTSRRETTKMIDTKHPEYDHERPDQSEIPLQSGTNKFASQKGMTGFGTNRRETSKIVDTNHPEYDPETSIDASSIPYQMGTNKYASQKGMTGFGQPRWEVLDPSISWQNRKSQGMVRLQSGTNRFASQQGMTGFGTIRNTTYLAEAGELPYEDMKKSESIIPSQAGWNKGDSQKRMTSFGAPRDVKGKHLKRIWELEYPEEAEVSLDRL